MFKKHKFIIIIIFTIFTSFILIMSVSNKKIISNSARKNHNHLIESISPYLLQHAHNPVNWYPWSEEVRSKARKENKPILLSIGYSTCYWCHVMEREVFEDQEIAKLMNDSIISS